jgi:phosphatidylglycerophosphatase A
MVMNEKLIKLLATGFGAGLAPVAPGTAGTLVGVLICLIFSPLHWLFRLLIVIFLLVLAVYIAERAEQVYRKKDDQRIVIDEIAGFQVAMLPVAITGLHLLVCFVLFRIFDIWKPFPLRNFQQFTGGLGVVADDVGAGIYAGAIMLLLVFFGVL